MNLKKVLRYNVPQFSNLTGYCTLEEVTKYRDSISTFIKRRKCEIDEHEHRLEQLAKEKQRQSDEILHEAREHWEIATKKQKTLDEAWTNLANKYPEYTTGPSNRTSIPMADRDISAEAVASSATPTSTASSVDA